MSAAAAATSTAPPGSAGVGRRRFAVFAVLAASVAAADQLLKSWVDGAFQLAWTRSPVPGLADPTPILGDFLRIAKSYNDGGLFGLFGASAPILAVASLAVIALLMVVQARNGAAAPPAMTLALGLLLGGAVGNFIDRIRFGYVIDFADMGLKDWRWYTFNVADAAISLAIVLFILSAFVPQRTAREDAA